MSTQSKTPPAEPDDLEARAADDFFEMSLDNVCIAGLDGYFKRTNPSWTRTLGWTPEEFVARPNIEFVHPDDREATLAAREKLRAGASMGPLVNRYLCKGGGHRWFEWRSVAHTTRGLVYAVARDITEQREAEERLRESREVQERLQRQLIFADRMKSIGTLAAGVAHEINNPLAYVTANLAMVVEELERAGSADSSPALLKMVAEAQHGAERIRTIVGGLNAFARPEEERRAPIDLEQLLELSIRMTANELRPRAKLVRQYGALPTVIGDEARLGQVFINLLVNAAHAITTRTPDTSEVVVATETDSEGRAVIEIRDTGHGIPADLVHRVFDAFFTTKPVGVGSGLGLYICHSIITDMGGEISISSAEGRGTTVRIVLPASLAAPAVVSAPPAKVAATSPASGPARAVLVVDDEPAIGSVLRRVLGDHDVTAVTSAKQALELLASGRRFDVILSDLMMPEMSGMEFYAELTRKFEDAVSRVIFVSGGAYTPDAEAFLAAVPNERVTKPFTAQRLRELVAQLSATPR